MSRRQIISTFNSEIKEALSRNSIAIHDGLGYLLSLHHGVDPSYIPMELQRKVLAAKIISKDYANDEIKWLMPLFEETESGFEWISEWMDLFKAINPERRGVKADALRRMKKFFVNNPSVRKTDVFDATNLYLSTVTNPMYCKKSHKFIYEQDGTSMLLDFVEQKQDKKSGNIHLNDDII